MFLSPGCPIKTLVVYPGQRGLSSLIHELEYQFLALQSDALGLLSLSRGAATIFPFLFTISEAFVFHGRSQCYSSSVTIIGIQGHLTW